MECPVCFEIYKNPLLLPGCGHTVCQACCQLMVTEGNFLRCPECRLIYQLRRGIQSLPRNVALQRTIEEQQKLSGAPPCEEHPDDAVSLYCRTCDKAICLKCYFSNTLRRGSSMHSGHQVHTSEDALSKEKRLLEELCRGCEDQRQKDVLYIDYLEQTQTKLATVMADKLSALEKSKSDVISTVNQTAAKLRFILRGSVARDEEALNSALMAAKSRLSDLEGVVTEAAAILSLSDKNPSVATLKEAREKLNELPRTTTTLPPDTPGLLLMDQFDTDLQPCLHDPGLALAYQTEVPRVPTLCPDDLIVSTTRIHVTVRYDEKVRVSHCLVYYRPTAADKTDDWLTVTSDTPRHGRAAVLLSELHDTTVYCMYAVAVNKHGESNPSKKVQFTTLSGEVTAKIIDEK